jgi:hypothetical protein
MVWRRDWRLVLRAKLPLGLLVILAIMAPWCIMLELKNPGAMEYMLINENLKRAIDARWPPDYDVSKASLTGYMIIALVWMAPWSLLLPQTLTFVSKKSIVGAPGTKPLADAMAILLLSAAIPIAVFLPMKSRLVYYCLPSVPPMAVLAAGWWVNASQEHQRMWRLTGGWTLVVLGAVIFSAGFWVPDLIDEVPLIRSMPAMLVYVAHLGFALGVALAAGGVLLLLKRERIGMAALAVILTATQFYNLQGFAEFDAIWSSRQMMAKMKPLIADDVVWISEGSKEIGAAAGTAFYLRQDKDGNSRNVLVMKDSKGREPPAFPGAEPSYLIDKPRLAELWASSQAAVYVTDFHRSDWVNDPPSLPPGDLHEVDLQGAAGNRRVYANDAAWQRLSSRNPH